MCSFLLKKAIPFALTLIIGSVIGGLFKSVGFGVQRTERSRAYFYGYGEGRSGCKHARGRYLVAESKPLTILFKPDASWPEDFKTDASSPFSLEEIRKFPGASVRVTFGADGKVQWVEPSYDPHPSLGHKADKVAWECMARAARQIQFAPETVDGVPVTVTREVEIRFMPTERP
jgi:hypothetical protein